MGNRILYLECYSGISGDMTVSSLLDLGGNQELLLQTLKSLNVPRYEIKIGRRDKCGIDTASFDVILEEEHHNHDEQNHDHPHHHTHDEEQNHEHSHAHSDEHNHSHDHQEHEHNHEHNHSHGHEHSHHHDHSHSHEHDHNQSHPGHTHGDGHTHSHHRNIHDIFTIIDGSSMTDRAKELARRTFDIVAVAESKAHGLPVDEVHFHEVGAIDSIVDIVAACVLVDDLHVDEIVISEMHEGRGHVWCQHGVIPVPVPATLNIVTEHNLEMKITDNEGEMITPTGAALAAALRTKNHLPEKYRILKVGLGSGKKDFKKANILRAYLLEDKVELKENQDEIYLLETNLDDTTGEALGYTLEKLMASKAKDVFYTPIFMKKNRPGYRLSVLCYEEDIKAMEDIIFTNTTSIGIRRMKMERTILPRRTMEVKTPYGLVRVKGATHDGVEYFTPEYEDVKKILWKEDVTYKALYEQIMDEIKKRK